MGTRILILIFLFISCNTESTQIAEYRPISISYNEDLSELLGLINNRRDSLGLVILTAEKHITEVAEEHVLWMMQNGVSHEGFDERVEKINKLIGIYGAVLELIGYGYKDNYSLFNAYLESPKHKASLESNSVDYIGIAKFYGEYGEMYNTIIMIKLKE